MIAEGYFGQIKNYPETDWLICVARKYPWFVKRNVMGHLPSLAPSKELLADWKAGNIDWDTYDSRFRLEIGEAGQSISDLAYVGIKHEQGETVRLMCWEKNPPCHRFILLDMLSEFTVVPKPRGE